MKSRCPKMSAQILGLVIAPLALPLALPVTALAASHKRAPAKEVYAATDASEMQPGQASFAMPVDSEPGAVLTAPAAAPAPAAKPSKTAKSPTAARTVATAPVETAPVSAPVAAVAPSATAPASEAKSARMAAASYDTVPASQSEAILQRLKIVENLLRKYGRAYDYRTHTLKELAAIQNTLESTVDPVAAPARAAAPVAPAVAAPQATSDTVRTGQAAAIENAEDVNLSALPAPQEFDSNNDNEEN